MLLIFAIFAAFEFFNIFLYLYITVKSHELPFPVLSVIRAIPCTQKKGVLQTNFYSQDAIRPFLFF